MRSPEPRQKISSKVSDAYEGPVHVLGQVYQGMRALLEVHPETPQFTTAVQSCGVFGDDGVGPGGEVPMALKEITFVEEGPAHWRFDGAVAFGAGQLCDAQHPGGADLLGTDGGRWRLGEVIREAVALWFGGLLIDVQVKGGFMRGESLVAIVSLVFVDEQEKQFGALAVSFKHAGEHVADVATELAENCSSDTLPLRVAIERARIAAERLQSAAVTNWQKANARHALGFEKRWREADERLTQFEAAGQGRHRATMS